MLIFSLLKIVSLLKLVKDKTLVVSRGNEL